MSKIVAGIFDSEATAGEVVHELRRAGFEVGDIDQFVLNPPGRHDQHPLGGDQHADPGADRGGGSAAAGAAIGGALGAAVGVAATPLVGPVGIAGGLATGAYVGSLAGAMGGMRNHDETPRTRPAGVMLAVNAEFDQDQEVAIDLMRDAGAQMIERADGVWRNGKWTDFDPVRPPTVLIRKAA